MADFFRAIIAVWFVKYQSFLFSDSRNMLMSDDAWWWLSVSDIIFNTAEAQHDPETITKLKKVVIKIKYLILVECYAFSDVLLHNHIYDGKKLHIGFWNLLSLMKCMCLEQIFLAKRLGYVQPLTSGWSSLHCSELINSKVLEFLNWEWTPYSQFEKS